MIDVFATPSWYLDHLRPIADALGPHLGRLHDGRLSFRRRKTGTILVASYGDLRTAVRQGYERFILAQHGAGQSYSNDSPSFPGGRNQQNVGLFLCPNEHSAERWRQAYPLASVAIIGCPKLDTLPARKPGPGPVIAFSTHWDYQMVPETRSAFDEYAPVLPELAKRFKVIGHGHPRRRNMHRDYQRFGIEFVRTFDEVCRRADVYVCDNSSSMYEFAATGRPVVVLNSRHYRRNIHHGLRFWEAAGVGVNVDRPFDLLAAVERALELRPEDVAARESALDIVYPVREGSAQLAAAAILEWAKVPIAA